MAKTVKDLPAGRQITACDRQAQTIDFVNAEAGALAGETGDGDAQTACHPAHTGIRRRRLHNSKVVLGGRGQYHQRQPEPIFALLRYATHTPTAVISSSPV